MSSNLLSAASQQQTKNTVASLQVFASAPVATHNGDVTELWKKG